MARDPRPRWIRDVLRALKRLRASVRRRPEDFDTDEFIRRARTYLDRYRRFEKMRDLMRAYAEEHVPPDHPDWGEVSQELDSCDRLTVQVEKSMADWLESAAHLLDARRRMAARFLKLLPALREASGALQVDPRADLGPMERFRDLLEGHPPDDMDQLAQFASRERWRARRAAVEFRGAAEEFVEQAVQRVVARRRSRRENAG